MPARVTPETGTRSASVVKGVGGLLRETGERWAHDECLRLGASLSFFALFSLFPLLLIAVTVIGFVLEGHDELRARILDVLASSGEQGSRSMLDDTLTSLQTHQTARGVGAVVGALTLLFGASGVFSELCSTLDIVWRVPPPPESVTLRAYVVDFVRSKSLAFLVVCTAPVVLLASLLANTAINAWGDAFQSPSSAWLWHALEAVASLVFPTLVFAAIFKMLPRIHVAWRDVIGGAIVTAVLFALSKGLFAWYLAHLGSYAAYGVVGGVLALLMWIYVVSLIVFFGAELSCVYAERYGSRSAMLQSPRNRVGKERHDP